MRTYWVDRIARLRSPSSSRRWWHFCRTAGTTRASMADSPMPPARSLSSLFRHALCPRCEPLNFMSPTLRSTHFTPLCKPSLTLLSSNTGGSTAPTCQKTRQHFVDTCRRGRYGRPRMAADTRWQSMLQASSPTAPGTPALPAPTRSQRLSGHAALGGMCPTTGTVDDM